MNRETLPYLLQINYNMDLGLLNISPLFIQLLCSTRGIISPAEEVLCLAHTLPHMLEKAIALLILIYRKFQTKDTHQLFIICILVPCLLWHWLRESSAHLEILLGLLDSAILKAPLLFLSFICAVNYDLAYFQLAQKGSVSALFPCGFSILCICNVHFYSLSF